MENITDFTPILSSTTAPDDRNIVLGLICVGIASIGFGINYLPIKKFDSGDGMFFQLVICTTIWFVGLVVNVIRGAPELYPLAMLGGLFWATGNLLTVPIIKTIGLGMGIMIWASTSIITGWGSGRFGWFGLKPEVPSSLSLNYLGLACAFLRAFIFIFIKPEEHVNEQANEHAPLLYGTQNRHGTIHSVSDIGDVRSVQVDSNQNKAFFERLPRLWQRILGVTFSIIAGVLFGFNFTPAIYVQDRYPGSSQNGLDYVFSQFCGILATGWLYFVIYCIVKKNKPLLYPRVILPAVLSGIIWAIAQVAFFVANRELYESVSFPIIASVPCVVGALSSIIFFGEIKGRKNYILLTFAFVVTFTGAALSALSF